MERPAVQRFARDILEGNGWKLAACPFCGDPEPVLNVHAYTLDVECRNCRATVDFDIERDAWRRMGFEGVLHNVVTKYNRRAP